MPTQPQTFPEEVQTLARKVLSTMYAVTRPSPALLATASAQVAADMPRARWHAGLDDTEPQCDWRQDRARGRYTLHQLGTAPLAA